MTSWSRPGRCSAGCGCCPRGPGCTSYWRWGCSRAWATLRVWGKLTAGLAGLDLPSPVGEGAAGPAPPPGPGAAEGAVRGGGRAAGPAAHARRAVRRAAHRRVRRAELGEGPRHRPQPGLAGEDPPPAGHGRVPGAAGDGAGRDRHPRPARRHRRLGVRPRRDSTWPGGCCPCWARACWSCWTGPSTPPRSSPRSPRTGAALLARAKSTRKPPVLAHLPDGSYLSRLDGGLAVRIIEAGVVDDRRRRQPRR